MLPPNNKLNGHLSEAFSAILQNTADKREVASIIKQLIDFVKTTKNEFLQQTDSLNSTFSKKYDSLGSQVQTIMQTCDGLVREARITSIRFGEKMSSMEQRIMNNVDEKLRKLDSFEDRMQLMEESMPDMDEMHEEIEDRIASVEAKIPTLPEEKDTETPLTELRMYFEEELKKRDAAITAMSRLRAISGPNANAVQYYDLSSQCDGATTSFYVPLHRVALMLVGTQAPVIYRPNTDFTTANHSLTLDTAQVGIPQSGQSLIFMYIK